MMTRAWLRKILTNFSIWKLLSSMFFLYESISLCNLSISVGSLPPFDIPERMAIAQISLVRSSKSSSQPTTHLHLTGNSDCENFLVFFFLFFVFFFLGGGGNDGSVQQTVPFCALSKAFWSLSNCTSCFISSTTLSWSWWLFCKVDNSFRSEFNCESCRKRYEEFVSL